MRSQSFADEIPFYYPIDATELLLNNNIPVSISKKFCEFMEANYENYVDQYCDEFVDSPIYDSLKFDSLKLQDVFKCLFSGDEMVFDHRLIPFPIVDDDFYDSDAQKSQIAMYLTCYHYKNHNPSTGKPGDYHKSRVEIMNKSPEHAKCLLMFAKDRYLSDLYDCNQYSGKMVEMQNGVDTGVGLRRYAFDDKYESFIKSLEDSFRVSFGNDGFVECKNSIRKQFGPPKKRKCYYKM